ncbi:MAG: hypothetical protein HXS44_11150 [Theionarchaea archaeon]|nr:hypothetical protein [Theionarchaea archaeon]
MRSRKILVAVVAGLLVVSFLGPAVAYCGNDCETTELEECTIKELLEWLVELLVWMMGLPDGPPPIPGCIIP